MFKDRLAIGSAAFLLLVLCLSDFAVAQTKSESRATSTTTYVIRWSVFNAGGKTEEATSESYRLKDAIGQPFIGKCESANYKLKVGFWAAKQVQVGIAEKFAESSTIPQIYSLSQNYPNPMVYATKIEYTLPKDSQISLRIYNISGQLVKTLVEEQQSAGNYKVSWDGRDESGKKVTSGIYFYKLQTQNYTQTRKLTLLR